MSQGVLQYRRLLRAVGTAFKGDQLAIFSARQEVRKEFEKNRGVTSSSSLQQLYAMAEETADFLRTCIVQGKVTEHGAVAVQLQPHHDGAVLETPKEARSAAKPDDPDACYTG